MLLLFQHYITSALTVAININYEPIPSDLPEICNDIFIASLLGNNFAELFIKYGKGKQYVGIH